MEFLIIVIMIGIGIAVATAQANKRKISDAWNEAAAQLRIQHNQGDLFTKRELHGKIKQCHVKVTIRNKSQGKHSAKYTLYDVTYPQPLPFDLSLKEQTAFSGLKKLLGGQDIEVGDPEFDDFVVVKSHDSIQAKRFLHPARRLYVRRILSMHSGAEITDSNVKWDSKGAEDDAGTLVSNVKRLVDCAINMANEVEQQNDEPIGTGTDTSPKRLGDDMEAVFTVRDRSEPHIYMVNSVTEPVEPIHMEVEEQEFNDPTDVFDRMEEDIEELLQTDSVTPDAIDVPQENRVELPPTDSPGVHEVCRNLFGPGKISFQINETFTQHYEGMEVQWTGKLTRVDSYPFDLVFGNDPGTKAEFEIDQLEGESHLVKAVLQLPADAHEALSERTGETIAFAGTLMKCDSFMRVLFVGHGRIGRS